MTSPCFIEFVLKCPSPMAPSFKGCLLAALLPALTLGGVGRVSGFALDQPSSATGLQNCARWDAAPREIDGNERSLHGGLRFSLLGGSYEAFRDFLSWTHPKPSVEDFKQAVLDAFAVWETVDSASGLGTDIYFVPDLGTQVRAFTFSGPNPGSEIDIAATPEYPGQWTIFNTATRAYTKFPSVSVPGDLTLTSGTEHYAGTAIRGADIVFANNQGAWWDLPFFKAVLAHEIGHALGLSDVQIAAELGKFVDDNYDPSDSVSNRTTLNNSFAKLIDPYDPASSPLRSFTVKTQFGGLSATGVGILMDGRLPPVFQEPTGPGPYLTADDFAGRQFLYPVVPKPPLSISMDGADVVLRWPDTPSWQPQRSPSLLSSDWSLISTPSVLQGNLRTLRVRRTLKKEFYRLNSTGP